jgi:hypothetical protein
MKKIVLGLVAFVGMLLLPSVGLACSCTLDIALLRKPEDQQIKIARKRAKAVFLGQVVDISIDENTKSYRARIKIQRSWKNIGVDELIVNGTTMCCICEYVFHVGETYLVYANDYDRQGNEYGTSICTRTVPLLEAEKDLRVLGKGRVHDRRQAASSR